jgi:hypothetical protein
MRKVLLGLTAAAALGALVIPNVASAANSHGGSGEGRSAGVASHSFNGASGSGARFNANVGGTRNFAARPARGNSNVQNFSVRNNARNFAINNNAQRWNGQRWAGNDRHHHRHNGRWLPYAVFGDYAAYDQCWQSMWTPSGYQRVFVCGPDGSSYY